MIIIVIRRLQKSSLLFRIEGYVDGIITLAEAILDICDVQGTSGIEYGMMEPKLFPIFLKNKGFQFLAHYLERRLAA